VTTRRVLDATAGVLFVVPLASVWGEAALPLVPKLLAGVIAVATLARPMVGLSVVAGLLSLTPALQVLTRSPAGVAGLAEALILPLLGAGFLRLALAPDAGGGRLGRPASLLALVVAVGGAVLTAAEFAYLPLSGVAIRTWHYVTRDYFSGEEVFGDFHRAAGWIVGLGLAVLAERVLGRDRAALRSVTRMAVVGAAAAALLSINRVAEVAIRSPDPWVAVARAFDEYRFSPFYSDLNAAGSLQVLFLVPAMWIAAVLRERWAWLAVGAIAPALWFTGSRAALVAFFAGAALAWGLARRIPRRRWVAAGLVILGASAFVTWTSRPGRAAVSEALAIRWSLAELGLRVAATDPVLGVGADRLRSASAPLVGPDLVRRYPPAAGGDNAHNNFVQVLAEFGVIGFAALSWLLVASLRRGSRDQPEPAGQGDRAGILGGLVAFLLTGLAGHPLLDPNVRLCFFLWVGLAAASTAGQRWPAAGRWSRGSIAAALVLVAAVLPGRIAVARHAADLRGIVLGAGPAVQGPDGQPYRPVERRSSFFVSARSTVVELPLRHDAEDPAPCRVEVGVDGQPAWVFEVGAGAWHPGRLLLPPAAPGRTSRRIDLMVVTDDCRLLVGSLTAR